jgi:hypothetical protein
VLTCHFCVHSGTMRCAVCAVGVDVSQPGPKLSSCGVCRKKICGTCHDDPSNLCSSGDFRCKYCISIVGSDEGGPVDTVTTRTRSFRDLGMGCIGQPIAFVQVDDSGAHTGWTEGTLLVSTCDLPSPILLPFTTTTLNVTLLSRDIVTHARHHFLLFTVLKSHHPLPGHPQSCL